MRFRYFTTAISTALSDDSVLSRSWLSPATQAKPLSDAPDQNWPAPSVPHTFGLGDEKDNVMTGGDSVDTLQGFAGNDRLSGEERNDTLLGGVGNDLLFGGKGHDKLFGGPGNDRGFGGTGRDALHGGKGTDLLLGQASNDVLEGGPGHDRLKGGIGADRITGGKGQDMMRGGPDGDKDTFLFSAVSDSLPGVHRRDIISDFESGEDKLDFTAIDGDTGTAGNQALVYGQKANGLSFVFKNGSMLGKGDVDGDGKADFVFELVGVGDLDDTDFLL